MEILTKKQFNDGRRRVNRFHKALESKAKKELRRKQIKEWHESEHAVGML